METKDRQNTDRRSEIPEGGLLSVPHVAEYLDVSQTFARGLIGSGELPSVKVGYLRRVRRQDLDTFIQRCIEAAQDRD